MGYFQVRYDSRVVIYDRRGFIRLATVQFIEQQKVTFVFDGKERKEKKKRPRFVPILNSKSLSLSYYAKTMPFKYRMSIFG